jgi:hypothetical protein
MKPRQFKIPTLLGMFSIVVVGIILGVLLVYSKQIFNLLIPADEKPGQVRITNVGPTSFTASWVTLRETEGFIQYGSGNSLDTRQGQDEQISSPSLVHSVSVEGLKPETSYNFQVGSGKGAFGKYSVQTSREIKEGEADIVFGEVVNAKGGPLAGALVYITIQGGQPMSTITDETGAWTLNLGRTLSADLMSRQTYNKKDGALEVFIQTGNSFASARTILGASRPIPTMTIGKSYDFTKTQTGLNSSTPKSQLALPSLEATESSKSSVDKTR